MKLEIMWFILEVGDGVLPIGHEYVAIIALEALRHLHNVSNRFGVTLTTHIRPCSRIQFAGGCMTLRRELCPLATWNFV